jgi:hypothetical protein
MLKLFRTIRYDLIDKNKTGKYLKYAIGEILLVTIGILLALQINNWNENRKNSSEEIKILYALKDNLQANEKTINERIEFDFDILEKGDLLLSILEDENSVYDESMEELFGSIGVWTPVTIKDFAYENLKAKGVSIIANDVLRSEVTRLFDDIYGQQKGIERLFMFTYVAGLNIKLKYLKAGDFFYKMQPNNFTLLKKTDEFKNLLAFSTGTTRAFRENYKYNILKETTLVLGSIEKEIADLENQ